LISQNTIRTPKIWPSRLPEAILLPYFLVWPFFSPKFIDSMIYFLTLGFAAPHMKRETSVLTPPCVIHFFLSPPMQSLGRQNKSPHPPFEGIPPFLSFLFVHPPFPPFFFPHSAESQEGFSGVSLRYQVPQFPPRFFPPFFFLPERKRGTFLVFDEVPLMEEAFPPLPFSFPDGHFSKKTKSKPCHDSCTHRSLLLVLVSSSFLPFFLLLPLPCSQ